MSARSMRSISPPKREVTQEELEKYQEIVD